MGSELPSAAPAREKNLIAAACAWYQRYPGRSFITGSPGEEAWQGGGGW